ncbi:glycosyltransferase family 4 protein [Tepidamorphus sp. 3E244]|uniref:glycosyltransferase family 4 protein n=1 Tax=Tepidamorphus sp. 3E244 TaxID=3385498 RepID=UPI0038FC4477
MKVLLATDAWYPQVNGVVRCLDRVRSDAQALGADFKILSHEGFRTMPLPTYSEIRLALAPPGAIARKIEAFNPEYVHIATEGPIGHAVRKWCINAGQPFTTSYHTRFPEYLRARVPVPVDLTYRYLARFHNAGRAVMVTTDALAEELRGRGFRTVVKWPRGVDHKQFRPREKKVLDFPGPISLYVGRVAVEKNIEGFLSLDIPGTKVVVGDGPQRAELERRFPDAKFLGVKEGEELGAIYSSADVFVFPSRTDTLGLVVMEALASGVPVVALPVTGPRDIIGKAPVGVLTEDLAHGVHAALRLSRDACREHALQFSWEECAKIFLDHLRTYQNDGAQQSAA